MCVGAWGLRVLGVSVWASFGLQGGLGVFVEGVLDVGLRGL